MPTKIKSDYKPSDRVFELLSIRFQELSFDRSREFVGHEIDEFRMYFESTGKPKANWDSACLNWMKRAYENKKEAMARNRTYGGEQDNAFKSALKNIETPCIDKLGANFAPNYKIAPKPEIKTGSPMSTEEALEQLRKFNQRG